MVHMGSTWANWFLSVHKLRDEFEAVLSRMSHEFPESPRRIAFLINNYDLIVSVFQVIYISILLPFDSHGVAYRKPTAEL